MQATNAIIVGLVTAAAVAGFSHPRMRKSSTWRATVTPLASIIGSGFLIVAPLLASSVGTAAPLAMAGVVGFAYLVGEVVRFNIKNLEPALESEDPPAALIDLERLSDLALGFAYVISVAFYLRLLASFVLRGFDGDMDLEARILATVLLAGIGALGWFRGLGGLEILEESAVATKLSIIFGLFAGLIAFDAAHWSDTISAYTDGPGATADAWTALRYLAGMLLVAQGFETSRYLQEEYDRSVRIRTMRYAQFVSSAIYILFIVLIVPLFGAFPEEVSDTAILDAASKVTPLLVPLVVIAAAASQLSAGVADTAGGGGMIISNRHSELGPRAGYLAVAFGAITVIWITNVFAIIALASRAFAIYYLIQAVLAFLCAPHVLTGRMLLRGRVGIGLVAAALAFVAVAGVPAG